MTPLGLATTGLLTNLPMTGFFLAETATDTGNPINWVSTLLNVGVTGILAWLLITNRLVTKQQFDIVRRDAEEARSRELALYNEVIRGVFPALGESIKAVANQSGGD